LLTRTDWFSSITVITLRLRSRSQFWQNGSDDLACPEHRSRSHDAVIRVYDEAGNVIETHEKRTQAELFMLDRKNRL
jgi:hypothetical protein